MFNMNLVFTGYAYAEQRAMPQHTFDGYFTAQAMDKIATFEGAYAHTGQAFRGVKRPEESMPDKFFVHACAAILNFYNSNARSGQLSDAHPTTLGRRFLSILY
jgi:hypothetical protein